MSLSCDECKEQLPLYIDGVCECEEAVSEHLANCAKCAEEDMFLRNISKQMGALPGLTVTDSFRDALHKRLMAEQTKKTPVRVRSVWKQVVASAAVCAVIALSVIGFGRLPETDIITEDKPIIQQDEQEKKPEVSLFADEVQTEDLAEEKQKTEPAVATAETDEVGVTPRFRYAAKGTLLYQFNAEAYALAEEFLSDYEFDGTGFLIPVEEIASTCAKLEELAGYMGHRPSSESPEAETEEEKERYGSFVWIVLEQAE